MPIVFKWDSDDAECTDCGRHLRTGCVWVDFKGQDGNYTRICEICVKEAHIAVDAMRRID